MCLDEFNRIPKGEGLDSVFSRFQGKWSGKDIGYFITMNPGYAGRTKMDFDRNAWEFTHMTVPGVIDIAQNMLACEGLHSYEDLAVRLEKYRYESMFTMGQAKNFHYDFGLRKIKEIVKAVSRAVHNGQSDEAALLHALMISVGAGVADKDYDCFVKLMTQNGFDVSSYVAPKNEKAVHPKYDAEKFQVKTAALASIFEQRHAVQVIGHGHGFVEAMIKANDYPVVKVDCMTAESEGFFFSDKYGHKMKGEAPSTGRIDDWIYGYFKDQENKKDWVEGKLPLAFKEVVSGETSKKEGLKIIHFAVDCIDPEFIETMNTLLDDNKRLNLANGELLRLPSDVRVLFEV